MNKPVILTVGDEAGVLKAIEQNRRLVAALQDILGACRGKNTMRVCWFSGSSWLAEPH